MTRTLNPVQLLRNIGIAAHIDAGKTTTTERILVFTGKNRKAGEVHDGNATTDFLPEEKKRGITIMSAVVSTVWKKDGLDWNINVIDTPGHVDFTIEVERSMRVLDGAIAVFDASQGVEPQSETVWRQADKYRVPRIAFVNKMDKVGADFEMVLIDMIERLGVKPVALQIPIGTEDSFTGIIDLLEMKAFVYDSESGFEVHTEEIPSEYLERTRNARAQLIETAADASDSVMHKFLNGEEVSKSELVSALRRGTIEQLFFPVLCGSSLKNKGIQLLLDAVIDFLPSPLEVAAVKGLDELGTEVEFPANPNGALTALAFKIVSDNYVGRLTFVRIYSGTLHSGSYVWNSSKQKKERVGRLQKIHASQREDVEFLKAGDLGAVVGIRDASTGDTLVGEQDAMVVLERIEVPEAVISLAVEPKTKADQDKLGFGLAKLAEEDPTFRVKTDSESGQTIISGMGELHLEILLSRLAREFNVESSVGAPQVAYRETITQHVEIDFTFKKQDGGNGAFAHIKIRAEPLERGKGFEFVNGVVGGEVPKEFISSVGKGIESTLGSGPLIGFPIVDLKVTLIGGSYHAVDSSDMAFKTAGSMAIKEAVQKGAPAILEPIMRVEVVTPEDFVGSIIGDLNARRGQIEGMSERGNAKIVKASVPLSEMFGYANTMRSLSQGRASYSMSFERYTEVPKHIMTSLVKTK
jgi:elongation factor G